ncbi:hypothetical protein CA267_002550 [Alteromonas pelagimontana]|uniref:Transporter substrate-binding domain-containing protein n=1 Tax=Alteromonas pelagimontana TaxID=1858656 RepID=A0A6M4M9B6_9ALTE|nr:hypothetical protein [Alteromonas pelagimontana]QJR79753.1 hypothetical protein CA267_002550 [Alteromonas pelagimontana]
MRFLSYFMLLCFSSCCASSEVGTTYHVGVENIAYYPIQDFSATPGTGILQDIVSAFAEETHIKVEFIPLPITRFATWYQERAIDFRIPDHPTWDDAKALALTYSDPVVTLCEATIVLAEHADKPVDFFNIIGMMHGFTASERWKTRIAEERLTIVTDTSLKVLTQMLLHNMVQGLDVDISTIRHELELMNLPPDTVTLAKKIPVSTLSYRMSTIEHPELLAKFDTYLKTHKEQNRELARSYGYYNGRKCSDIIPD